MGNRILRTIVRALATACLVAASTAQAAYYSSRWDPPSLVVNAVIEADGCGSSGFVWANQGGCTASLYSVIATLNNVDGVDLTPPSYIDFIAPAGFYGPGSPAVTDANADDVIWGLYFGPAGLAGVLWNPFATLGQRAEAPDLAGEGPWKLSFLNDSWQLYLNPWASGYSYGSTALLWDCAHRRCSELEDTASLQFQTIGATELYYAPLGDSPPRLARDGSPIPEPGSLALLAGALGAGWVTRRRRTTG